MPAPVSLTQHDHLIALATRRDRDPAALRHGVARVEEQVEEHLLQLVLDGAHHRPVGLQVLAHLDAGGAELVLEQRQHVVDDDVQVDRARLALRRTREVQQAVDDLGRAERLPLDLLEQAGARVVGIGLFEQHLREAGDAGERRVDLVGHAGGEQADGGHLLRDLELLLELHARR